MTQTFSLPSFRSYGGNYQAKKQRVDQDTFDRLWREQVEAVFNPQPVSDPASPFAVGALN